MGFFVPVDAATYSARVPYLSLAEYKNGASGTAWNNLSANTTSQPQRDTLLTQCLMRASSWADEICHQVLAATIQWKQGRSRVRSDDWGRPYFDAALDQTPLIGVSQVLVGTAPNDLIALADMSMLEPRGKNVLRVYLSGMPTGSNNAYWIGVGQSVLWQVQYIAGYANTVLTAAVTGAATSLPVADPLGFAPGQQVTLYGASSVEYPAIAATWAPSSSTAPASLPLAAATGAGNSYAIGDSVSAMPASIKEAVSNLATVAIRERGQWAIVMASVRGQAESVEQLEPATLSQLDIAVSLLEDHVRTI